MIKSILAVYLLIQLNIVVCKLVFVQVLFRHGTRYPLHPSEIDGTEYAVLENMSGELANQGKRMHYLLGKRLKQDYWNKLGFNNTFDSRFIYMKSTNVNRTLQSGQSHFLGWVQSSDPLSLTEKEAQHAIPPWFNKKFQIPAGPVFINSPSYKPNAIHTQKGGANALNSGDFLHAHKVSNCPQAQRWANQGYKSQLYKEVSEMVQIQKAVNRLQAVFNDSSIDMKKAATYFSNYQCNKRLGKESSDVFTTYLNEFKLIQSFVRYTSLASNDLQINATTTGFFNATLNSMNKIIQNKQRQKLVLYSAHDMTIVMVLAGLRLGSRSCALQYYINPNAILDCIPQYPDFGASLIFQLHEIDQQHFVRLRYNGQYLKIPFCNTKICHYHSFKLFIQQTMRPSFLWDCGVPPLPTQQNQTKLIVAVVILSIMLIIAIGYQMFLFKKTKMLKQKKNKYQQHIQEMI